MMRMSFYDDDNFGTFQFMPANHTTQVYASVYFLLALYIIVRIPKTFLAVDLHLRPNTSKFLTGVADKEIPSIVNQLYSLLNNTHLFRIYCFDARSPNAIIKAHHKYKECFSTVLD